ncbi:TldD/PmbA family protein [Varunaivibrio sulfuroxidans]|uniref:Microcin-processing peptidase 1 n=1 Tax=Varunaivibrio sulfuroxidans TaxID=1773489 RepID=A0A4R3J454_9PROT|nr:metallopeptidase TldD-related protein [Varunaivibrio sulfuroxidans]TCS60629.1 microcin-processing peptidase 1 [Varunaivibrio sulfuroxidans]WES30118.1 metallopeptidase TldD-related protein [Varunaivibrio sulfuroxidans]
MADMTNKLELIQDVIDKARARGADAADAIFAEGVSLSLARRLGALENLSRAEGSDMGLRVFVGKSQAIVSTSDTAPRALDALVERAVAMARSAPADPFGGIADPAQLATNFPDFDMCDAIEPDSDLLLRWTGEAEDAARAVKGVSNSEGAEAGWGKSAIAVAASNGFARAYERSSFSLSVSVLAGEGTAMERDYDYTTAVHAEDLKSPTEIGRGAGEKAVRRLNPRKVKSGTFPVIFDPRVSRTILGHFSGAINGAAVARGTSFLKDKMDAPVFAKGVQIIDDPHRRRGLRSAAFDDEGVATSRRALIDDGRLTSWLLDLRSARQLGLASTGHASRGVSSPPSPSSHNLYMAAGSQSPAELIGEITSGLYVTELIGFGVNAITGDYSRGAGGFWIENGVIAYPVGEITIAGNLKDMFMQATPADDLEFRYGSDCPTLRIDAMTVAGM